ncbi:LAFE_0F01156g1_1 [Lachancea fermentati]|uniref:LAFE_0F01156g1_1 n=1 Tax=Lachancea fermentati TaxID=4955 RepID=A0A1G4ME69_LACFM|nr:LAFE_0F01156g1_1 [Lachancea fermentati]
MVGLKVSDTPEVLLDASRDKELYAQTGSTAPKSTGSVDLSDSDSSDDDAPEEEGLSAGKDEMEKQVKEREQAIKREQDLLKEKRRKQNLKFAEQQEQKRSRELEEQKKRQTDEDLLTATESKELELPEELPDEFFDSLDEAEPAFVAAKPTYVNFNEIDGNYAQEVVQELKKKRRRHFNN